MQKAACRGFNLIGDLLGLNDQQNFALVDLLAFSFFPLNDLTGFHGKAQLGHGYICCHYLTPFLGLVTSRERFSADHLLYLRDQLVGIGQIVLLKLGLESDVRKGSRNAGNRCVKPVKQILLQVGSNFCAHAHDLLWPRE